jgi:hypothetical protein
VTLVFTDVRLDTVAPSISARSVFHEETSACVVGHFGEFRFYLLFMASFLEQAAHEYKHDAEDADVEDIPARLAE